LLNPSTAISWNFLPSLRWKHFPSTFRMRAPFLRQGQGGGFYISGGDVQLASCNIYSNGADFVSTCPKPPHVIRTRAPAISRNISWKPNPNPLPLPR
jgi:hypothetical protein